MLTSKTRVHFVCFLAIIFLELGTPKVNATTDSTIYSKYNIHIAVQSRRSGELVYNASYANYTNPGDTGHLIIPAGDKIEISRISRKSFNIFYPEKNINVSFEYHEPRMGIKVKDYIEKITSKEPISHNSLSQLDQQGIKEGKALVGMSRAGVMAALGYPATHRTPSLESSTFIYWTNRFGTIAVDFDDAGRVTNIRN